jgi:hypothetical protein
MMVQFDRLAAAFVPPREGGFEGTEAACVTLNDKLAEIRQWLNLKRRAGRYSWGFLVELVDHSLRQKVDIHAVFDEIGMLEGSDPRPSRTKKPKQMRGQLRGLWHKHYFQSAFILRNLIDETERMMKDGRWEQMFAPHYGKYVHEFIDQVSHQMVMGAIQQRARDNRLAGEFIVYEPQPDGSNYYLTLGYHGEWNAIRARVDMYKDFDADGG